jgi:beta-glucosidase
MQWANYHGYNFWGTTTILEGLDQAGNVEFLPGCEYAYGDFVNVDLWREITYSGRIGFEGKFYPNLNLEGTPTLVKHVPRLRWEDAGEASFGGDFTPTEYSCAFEGDYTATATETLEVSLYWDHGARFDFGDIAHVDNWGASRKGGVTVPVNVTAGQTYPLRVAYHHPAGRAGFSFTIARRITTEQSLQEVKAKAATSDAIIFVGGISTHFEGEERCRGTIELPEVQRSFLDGLKQTGKPVVFVLCQGSASAFDPSGLAAILVAWYPGQEGGHAVADVIFGDYNPAGRLPVTFYSSTSELNEYHDYDMLAGKGRTYRYYKGKALFPFGYGLSYTKFQYSDLEVVGDYTKGEPVDVSFVVHNVGNFAGDEVSQIYVTAVDVPGEPIKALKWFQRQQFEVGQEKEVVTRLHNDAFMVYDEAKDELVLRPGKFRIWVGGSSDDKDLIVKEVSFPNVIVGKKSSFVGNASGWKIGVIVGLAGIVLVIIAVSVIYSVKKHQGQHVCASEPLLPN